MHLRIQQQQQRTTQRFLETLTYYWLTYFSLTTVLTYYSVLLLSATCQYPSEIPLRAIRFFDSSLSRSHPDIGAMHPDNTMVTWLASSGLFQMALSARWSNDYMLWCAVVVTHSDNGGKTNHTSLIIERVLFDRNRLERGNAAQNIPFWWYKRPYHIVSTNIFFSSPDLYKQLILTPKLYHLISDNPIKIISQSLFFLTGSNKLGPCLMLQSWGGGDSQQTHFLSNFLDFRATCSYHSKYFNAS